MAQPVVRSRALRRLQQSRARVRPAADPRTRRRETALIAAARRGDRAAMSTLLERIAVPARRFSMGFCRDPHDTEDLVQEVLVTLLRTLGSFRGESSLSTWTYTVARRACARLRRRGARQASLDDLPERLELPAADAGPAARAERRQLGEALERAIAELPAAQREVLVLRDVEGLTAPEVGKALGLGERAVKSRLHRARLAMRARLAPFVAGGAAPPPGPECPDTARLLSRYVEGELTAAVCARLESHVDACASCTGACESLRAVLGACREHGERRLPSELRNAVRAAIRAAVREPTLGRGAANGGRGGSRRAR